MNTKTQVIRILIVLIVVGICLFAYDWYYKKPVRDEQARSFSVQKITHDEPLNFDSYL